MDIRWFWAGLGSAFILGLSVMYLGLRVAEVI